MTEDLWVKLGSKQPSPYINDTLRQIAGIFVNMANGVC